MQRVTDPTAEANKFGSGKSGHSEGVPGLIVPTRIRATWLDGVQEEIVRTIEGAGLTPSSSLDQLTAAIRLLGLGTYCLLDVAGSSDGTTKFDLGIVQQSGGFSMASDEVTPPQSGRYLILFTAPLATCSDTTSPLEVQLIFALGAATFGAYRPTAGASDNIPIFGFGVVSTAISPPWSLKTQLPSPGTVTAGGVAKMLIARLPG